MLILNELNFNSFSVGRVWWSFQNLFLQFLLLVGLVVMKKVIVNSFYFGEGCGGLERTDF